MIEKSPKNNILIVDDTPENLSILRKLLTEKGYQVRPALNGEVALKAVQSQAPDLILLDIMMPGMDGYEVCKILKANEETSHIPVIFISALTEVETILQAFGVGGVDYITKPFQSEEVLARVRTHLALQDAMYEKEAARKLLNTIMGSIDNAIITVDSARQIINSNKPIDSVCGELHGDDRTFQQRLLDGDGYCAEVLQQVFDTTKEVREYRIECNCGPGKGRTLVLNATPLANAHEELEGAVLVIRDITRLAELEKRLVDTHRYHGIIGKNDIKTPTTVIKPPINWCGSGKVLNTRNAPIKTKFPPLRV